MRLSFCSSSVDFVFMGQPERHTAKGGALQLADQGPTLPENFSFKPMSGR